MSGNVCLLPVSKQFNLKSSFRSTEKMNKDET